MSLEVDIKKAFSSFTLQIRLKAGNEIIGILGASGSGKSMTLKCIAGIMTPDEGIIVCDGTPLFDSDKKINVPPQKRRTGYLLQNAALFPNMTVEQNILCVIRDKTTRAQKRERIKNILCTLGLDGLEDRYPSELSGGQQQRAALARILVSEPRLIMLDEPFSALDSYLRWQLEQEISSVLSSFSGTSLFVSHNRDEVYRLCSRLAVVSEGSISTQGDKWEIFNNPESYAACLLTGCKNITEATLLPDGAVHTDEWDIDVAVGDRPSGPIKYVGIRAHDIILTDDADGQNTFEYETTSTLRDTFSYVLLIRRKGSSGKSLRLEISRERYEAMKSLPRYMRLPPEKLLLLTR